MLREGKLRAIEYEVAPRAFRLTAYLIQMPRSPVVARAFEAIPILHLRQSCSPCHRYCTLARPRLEALRGRPLNRPKPPRLSNDDNMPSLHDDIDARTERINEYRPEPRSCSRTSRRSMRLSVRSSRNCFTTAAAITRSWPDF